MSTIWNIYLLVLVMQILIGATNGMVSASYPMKMILYNRYRRETINNETSDTSNPLRENVAPALAQTSTPGLRTVSISESEKTDASHLYDNPSTPASTETLNFISDGVSTPTPEVGFPLFDCSEGDVIPISYEIFTTPLWDKRRFNAEANITMKVSKRCSTLTLPLDGLIVNDITLLTNKSRIVPGTTQIVDSVDDATDYLIINFDEPIPSGNYKLMLKYSGLINVIPQGLIEETGANISGLIITYGQYQFDFTAVKMTFPCWNSLEVKANFSISMELNSVVSLSNMPKIVDSYNTEDETITNFAKTPPFSMHEVSFLSSYYHFLRCKGIKQDTFCSNSADDFQIGQVIRNIEDLTNISHSQSQFSHLNIVTMRKYDLSADSLQILRCGLIITIHSKFILNAILTSYGIAYQWFRCLVTPTESLLKWLSTGLATYYGMEIRPEKVYQNYAEDTNMVERMEAMIYNADPIITSILSDVEDVNNIHDRAIQMVLNHKATSIVQMISYIMGRTELHTAVANYLKKNLNRTTTSVDLINELKNVSGRNATPNIEEVIKSWLSMQSLPSVTVVRNYTTGKIIITQNPLIINNPSRARLYDGMSIKESRRPSNSADERFWIPINYVTLTRQDEFISDRFSNKTVTHWISPMEKSIAIPSVGANEWIIINKQRFGYYRVNYDTQNWRSIIKTLNTSHFHLIDRYNRAQLIDDAFSFLEAGQLDYEIIFDLIGYFERETDYVTWIIAERHITRMFSTLLESPEHNFKEYMMRLSQRIADHEFHSYGKQYLHSTYPQLLTAFCRWGSTSCRTELIKIYSRRSKLADSQLYPISDEYRLNDSSAQLSNLILCFGSHNATDNRTWNKLEDQWNSNPLVLNIIACWPDKAMVKQFFSDIFKSSEIPSKIFFHIVDLFIISNVKFNIFPIFYRTLKENVEYMKMPGHISGPDVDLMLELIEVIASIKSPPHPTFHALRAFFKVNEARLETYFNRQDIREYLLRTEIHHLDLSLPIFNRFRKK